MAYILSPRIKLGEFIGQFIIGSIVSTAAAVVAGLIVQQLVGSAALTALTASATETVFWYLYLILYFIDRQGDSVRTAISHLVSDFGVAEVLDSFLVRPLAMYILPQFTHSQASGIVVATILADIVYTAIALNRQRHRTLANL